MKIVAISDTHNKHKEIIDLPEADMIIHAGDFTSRGDRREVYDFLKWFSSLDYKYKVFIAGNHDWFFSRAPKKEIEETINQYNKDGSLYYLQDSMVKIEGFNIYGSPWTSRFYNWAFNADDDELSRKWNLIPYNSDIVITHGPMYGIGDKAIRISQDANSGDRHIHYEHTGCKTLLNVLTKKIGPRLHVCGHIHESRGLYKVEGGVTSINASVLDERYKMASKPWQIDLK